MSEQYTTTQLFNAMRTRMDREDFNVLLFQLSNCDGMEDVRLKVTANKLEAAIIELLDYCEQRSEIATLVEKLRSEHKHVLKGVDQTREPASANSSQPQVQSSTQQTIQVQQPAQQVPNTVEALYQRLVIAYLTNDDMNTVITLGNQIIRIEPNYKDARDWLARAYTKRGDILGQANRFDEALVNLDKAIEIAPEMILSYKVRARLYLELGRVQEALADQSVLIEHEPTAFNYRLRGFTYEMLMHDEQAAKLDYYRAQQMKAAEISEKLKKLQQ